jgi:hypothetical protein
MAMGGKRRSLLANAIEPRPLYACNTRYRARAESVGIWL